MVEDAIARSPLKLILFGEHAVMSGARCIAVAVTRYGYLKMHTSSRGGIIVSDASGRQTDLRSIGYDIPGSEIEILLEAPLGCGMGTSAAISLLLSYAREGADMLDNAHEIEDVFHGMSSGVDVSTCHAGGLVSFRRRMVKRLPIRYIERFKIIFFDSKIPKNTAAAIKVGEHKKELYSEIAKVTEEAYKLLQRDFTLQELYKLIRRNQELLDGLGVCPPEMGKEVLRMRGLGVEAKVTGSGCGGCLVSVVNRDEEFSGWVSVSIDQQGFCIL